MEKYFNSIQWKLIVIYILLILISMQIIGLYFIQFTEDYYIDNFNETLDAQASLLSVNLERYLIEDKQNEKEIDDLVNNLFALNGVDVSIIDNSGFIISSSEKKVPSIVGKKISQTEVNRALLGTRSEAVRIDSETGHRIKYLAIPIKQGKNVLGVVFLKASVEDVYDTIYRINRILLSAIIIALIFTVLLGFLLSRTITKPIKEITKQAENIIKGDYNQQVKIYSNDEIGNLGETFNHMALRLSDAINQTEEEKEKLSNILSNMSDGVIATDKDERLILINQRALDLLGIKEAQVKFKNINDILGEQILTNSKDYLLYEHEVENDIKILKLTISYIFHNNNEKVGAIIVLYDVTKEQKLEQIRQDFVANVSHELRTPLTTIKSYLEALEDGAINDKKIANNFIKVASQETDRMIRLVNDLLLLSRMEENKTIINKSLISIGEMIEDVVDRFNFKFRQKSIDYEINLPENIPLINADRDKIDQVLNNLISNAIKYTNKNGKILVTVYKINKNLYVEIMDNGIGIPKNHFSRLFERFYRVDKARSREMGGTGLGLSISYEIIKAHQGEIYVESEMNRGTKFTFYIPIDEEDVT